MQFEIISIKTKVTENEGELSFFEGARDLPFNIKRIYYIYGVPAGVWRGAHAHKMLQQLIFCPYGSVKIVLDSGREKQEVLLNTPGRGLLIQPGLWRDMLWMQDNSVLCVAASDYYDESDYIRDYNVFLRFIRGENGNDS